MPSTLVTSAILVALIAVPPRAPRHAARPAPVRPPATAPADDSAGLRFVPSFEAAQQEAALRHVPIAIVFDAPWCGWCRKMEADVFTDAQVRAAGAGFVWVKVNIDEQPDLAAAFHVRGIPHTAVLAPGGEAAGGGRVLAQRAGYLPVDGFLRFLKSVPDAAASPLRQAITGGPEAVAAGVAAVVETLSKPDRTGRAEALAEFEQAGPQVWLPLVKLLDDERLARRAAAAQALARTTGAELAFDPFADAATRRKQVETWGAWVAEHRAGAEALKASPVPSTQPAEAP